jgi:hypothetical protein
MENFTYAAERAGRVDLVNNPAGQAAGRLTAREPAGMIVRRLAADAARVIEELGLRSPRPHERGRDRHGRRSARGDRGGRCWPGGWLRRSRRAAATVSSRRFELRPEVFGHGMLEQPRVFLDLLR